MHLQGHFEHKHTGLQTCGLATLTNFYFTDVNSGEEEAVLSELFDKMQWSSNATKHGTLVFSLSTAQIAGRNGFLKYLCEHPNTKCMHHYTNDAHGPNKIYLCVHHYNEKNTRPQKQPQLMEVFK